MDFPEVSLKEANKQRLKAFTCARACPECGDFRRFVLCSDWCCATCYDFEGQGFKNTDSVKTIQSHIYKHNQKVKVARGKLTGIPRVFGSYNTGLR